MDIDLDMWMLYRSFVLERHKIWERRQVGEPGPWTKDPVLASRKFTNVFRLLDFGTQYVLTDLAGSEPRDELFRLFLYRHTGRVEAWQYLMLDLGRAPGADDEEGILEAWDRYRGPGVWKEKNVKPYAERPNKARGHGYVSYKRPVFTGAYLVFPQSQERGTDKVRSIVDLATRTFDPQKNIAGEFYLSDAERKFGLLRSQKGVGDFMAMQTLADWNYLHAGDENAFVVAGPGARRGSAHLSKSRPEDVIRWALEAWEKDSEVPILAGRPPSLMDVQNTMCEFSKYVRYLGQAPGRAYEPAHPGPQEPPVLPQHWTTKGTSK